MQQGYLPRLPWRRDYEEGQHLCPLLQGWKIVSYSWCWKITFTHFRWGFTKIANLVAFWLLLLANDQNVLKLLWTKSQSFYQLIACCSNKIFPSGTAVTIVISILYVFNDICQNHKRLYGNKYFRFCNDDFFFAFYYVSIWTSLMTKLHIISFCWSTVR